MIYKISRTRALAAFCGLFLCLTTFATPLEWSPENGPDGIWSATAPNWWDGSAQTPWPAGADALIGGAPANLTLLGAIEAGTLDFATPGHALWIQRADNAVLRTERLDGEPIIRFGGLLPAGADNHADPDLARAAGLWVTPTADVRLEADLVPFGEGSPILGVRGAGGIVDFAGKWVADTGSIISWVILDEGGHLRFAPEADMRFIRESFYTLQLWVNGDGTGTLELDEDFVADRTERGAVRLGIGSIRMGAGSLVTHHSANLPLGYRPQANGTAQTNGHMAFEDNPGTRWITRTNPQVYPGAVWVYQDMEVRTEADLTHVGMTEVAFDYTALNGWTLFAPVTVTKTGPARLALGGDQAYPAGAVFSVDEGTLEFLTSPSNGLPLDGGSANLAVDVAENARLSWQTDGGLRQLHLSGTLDLGSVLQVAGSTATWTASSKTRILLSPDSPPVLIRTNGATTLGGTLIVERLPGWYPEAGYNWTVLEATALNGNWTLDDRTGMGLQFDNTATAVRLVAGNMPPTQPGEVLLADDFSGDLGAWADLSTVPLWGNPAAHGSAFEQVGDVIRLIRSGPRDTTPFTGYLNTQGLKTFTALDHRFDKPIDRTTSQLTIDFHLRWPVPTASSGEGGRFIISLNHAYPENGLDLTPEGVAGSRWNDFSAPWWARPAYHVRLRNSTTGAGPSFLQYGGGETFLGEYERTPQWWLPGFISGAGGIAPGAGEDFPANSWVRTSGGMASDTFTTFRYRILPDRQELWRDANGDGILDPDELVAVMPLPPESEAPFYNTFPTLEGLRLFWSGVDDNNPGSGQVEVDWIVVTHNANLSPTAEAGPDRFATVLVDGRAPIRLDASASSDPEGDALTYLWWLNDTLVHFGSEPATDLLAPPGEHVVTSWILDAAGNLASDQFNLTVVEGNARPTARAGQDRSVTAANGWFAVVTLDGSASSDPDGEIVRYRWTMDGGTRVIYDGPEPSVDVGLGIGSRRIALTVWDNDHALATDDVRIDVFAPLTGQPDTLIYRENFSRPSDGGEMGADAVGWSLTRPDGEPVITNAHRCLNTAGSDSFLPRVNSNPTGLEYDEPDALGHIWMNQMPFLNASPSEWMLWTDEFAIDRQSWDLASFRFRARDGSTSEGGVQNTPAVRIDGQWYLGWDMRVESQWGTDWNWSWRSYTINLGQSGWYRFDPSPTFSILNATRVDNLPAGEIEAFGLYFRKLFGWHNNRIDNFEVWVRPRAPLDPYGQWLARHFPPTSLALPREAGRWHPEDDASGDGLPNRIAFALDRDPFTPGAGVSGRDHTLENLGEGWRARLRIHPAADNVTIALQFSPDLVEWTPHPAPGTPATDHHGNTWLEWTLPEQAGAASTFVRWVIE